MLTLQWPHGGCKFVAWEGSDADLLNEAPSRVKETVRNNIRLVAWCLVLDGAQEAGQDGATI